MKTTHTVTLSDVNPANQPFVRTMPDTRRLSRLKEFEKQEVLAFLASRPVHTVVMTSYIRDNGFDSSLNRGVFYGYRGTSGALEGVALIGHTTLIEARSEEALTAFAGAARKSRTPIHFMMSNRGLIETFWDKFAGDGRTPRLVCKELLFELSFPLLIRKCDWTLRLAEPSELLPVAEAHAEVAFLESGVNPLAADRERFLARVLRRIQQKRVFVVFEGERLIFKADIAAETSEVAYLEGIYVHPEQRGKGIGSSCLTKLSRILLEKAKHVCLLSNINFKHAHRTYLKAGFKLRDCCITMFV